MSELIRIEAAEPIEGYWIRLTFSDGAIKDVDLGAPLARGGVFSAVHDDRRIFERVRVNPESRTIEWPGEVDLDPEVLYGRFEPSSGVKIPRRTVREPTAAHAKACDTAGFGQCVRPGLRAILHRENALEPPRQL